MRVDDPSEAECLVLWGGLTDDTVVTLSKPPTVGADHSCEGEYREVPTDNAEFESIEGRDLILCSRARLAAESGT